MFFCRATKMLKRSQQKDVNNIAYQIRHVLGSPTTKIRVFARYLNHVTKQTLVMKQTLAMKQTLHLQETLAMLGIRLVLLAFLHPMLTVLYANQENTSFLIVWVSFQEKRAIYFIISYQNRIINHHIEDKILIFRMWLQLRRSQGKGL